jgi:processing peptidase subunit beta
MAEALSATALQVQRLGLEGGIIDTELERSKTQLKASLMQQLGTFSFICEDLGRQLLTYGRRMSTAEVFARIDAVTLEDIRSCAKRFTDGSQNVAVGALGSIDGVPDYDFINGVFLRK